MHCSITYIHHNCFVLKTGPRAYLFDYPADKYLQDGYESLVREAVADTDLVVCISHSHQDHMNDDLVTMAETARRVRYILSDDVEELRPSAIPVGAEVLVVEPDETYALESIAVETLMSNDLGVAFLVADGPFRFYYGGDLAKWIWRNASPEAAAFTENFFGRALARVHDFAPHVAFSNVDQRVPDLAGGVEAYEHIGAEVFVPMHTFGHTAWLDDFRSRITPGGPRVFSYAKAGESADFIVG